MSEKEKLVVVDGFNFLFRAFYAVRSLTRSDGFPTNALYGFTQMLLKVIEDVQPHYLAVAIDTPRTFTSLILFAYFCGERFDCVDWQWWTAWVVERSQQRSCIAGT